MPVEDLIDVVVTVEPELVRERAAARILDVGTTTLAELVKAGEIKKYRIRGCVVFKVAELREFASRLEPVE